MLAMANVGFGSASGVLAAPGPAPLPPPTAPSIDPRDEDDWRKRGGPWIIGDRHPPITGYARMGFGSGGLGALIGIGTPGGGAPGVGGTPGSGGAPGTGTPGTPAAPGAFTMHGGDGFDLWTGQVLHFDGTSPAELGLAPGDFQLSEGDSGKVTLTPGGMGLGNQVAILRGVSLDAINSLDGISFTSDGSAQSMGPGDTAVILVGGTAGYAVGNIVRQADGSITFDVKSLDAAAAAAANVMAQMGASLMAVARAYADTMSDAAVEAAVPVMASTMGTEPAATAAIGYAASPSTGAAGSSQDDTGRRGTDAGGTAGAVGGGSAGASSAGGSAGSGGGAAGGAGGGAGGGGGGAGGGGGGGGGGS